MSKKSNDLLIVCLFAFSKYPEYQRFEEFANQKFEQSLRLKYRSVSTQQFNAKRQELIDEIRRTGAERLDHDYSGPRGDASRECAFLHDFWKCFLAETTLSLEKIFKRFWDISDS